MNLFLESYLGLIGLIFKPRLKADALIPIFVCVLAVGSVLAVIGKTQVAKAIICLVAVYVVDLLLRYLSGHVIPRKAMGRAVLSVNLKVDVPLVMQVPGSLPHFDFGPRGCPRKNARIRVVSKNLEQFFVRYVFHGRGVPPSAGTEKD